jgi:ankyrin repeat protein
LMIASLNNHPQVVATLLRRGAYADAQNATGWTALMIAERKGHAEVARLLRYGRVEKPLPSLITSSTPSAEGKELDLSDFPEESSSEFPEQIKD